MSLVKWVLTVGVLLAQLLTNTSHWVAGWIKILFKKNDFNLLQNMSLKILSVFTTQLQTLCDE